MYEDRKMYSLRPPLGHIEVRRDPARRIYVSGLPQKTRRPSKAEKIAGILSGVISAGSCLAMVYLTARVAGMI